MTYYLILCNVNGFCIESDPPPKTFMPKHSFDTKILIRFTFLGLRVKMMLVVVIVMKRLLHLLVLIYTVAGGDKVREVLEVISDPDSYTPTVDDLEYVKKYGGCIISSLIKSKIKVVLSRYPKSVVEYICRYALVIVHYDEDLNPIIPAQQRIAAHLLENFNTLISFCETCKKHLPSIKEQIKFFKYRLQISSRLKTVEESIFRRFPEVDMSTVYDVSEQSRRLFNQSYPIRKLNIFDVYSELKYLLKTLPPDLLER